MPFNELAVLSLLTLTFRYTIVLGSPIGLTFLKMAIGPEGKLSMVWARVQI